MSKRKRERERVMFEEVGVTRGSTGPKAASKEVSPTPRSPATAEVWAVPTPTATAPRDTARPLAPTSRAAWGSTVGGSSGPRSWGLVSELAILEGLHLEDLEVLQHWEYITDTSNTEF